MGDSQLFTGPVGPEKDVNDCHRVRTNSLETRHSRTRWSVHLIGTVNIDDGYLEVMNGNIS
jgi:hypothetical protein